MYSSSWFPLLRHNLMRHSAELELKDGASRPRRNTRLQNFTQLEQYNFQVQKERGLQEFFCQALKYLLKLVCHCIHWSLKIVCRWIDRFQAESILI